jgi:CheY-like chemotaxis protein
MNDKVILLVEDNPDDEALALRALEKNKITAEVVVVRDGVEALDYLQISDTAVSAADSPLPQIVLLDLKLPRIGGLEVLRRIREHERTRKLVVVVLTSSLEEQDLTRAYNLHVNSYIRKPVDFTQFVEVVRQIGLYWLVQNEPPPL